MTTRFIFRSFRSREALLFCAGIAMWVIVGIGLAASGQPQVSLGGDASDYIQTARNLIERGIWSADPSPDAKWDNLRTPIYPLILIPFIFFNIPLFFLVFFQGALIALTAILLYRMGRRIVGEYVAFFAGLAIALDPYLASFAIARAVMTESVAIFFFTAAILNLALYIQGRQQENLKWGAALLALAALTKPQFFIFFIFLIAAAFLGREHRQWIKNIAISYGIFFAILSPWLLYNAAVLKTQFSSVSQGTLYVFADYFEQWRTRSADGGNYEYPINKAIKFLGVENYTKLWQPENARVLEQKGKDIIFAHPFLFAVYHAVHMPRLFYHDLTVDTVMQTFGIDLGTGPGETDVNVVKRSFRGDINGAFAGLKRHPHWIFSLAFKFTIIILALAAFSSFILERLVKKKFSRSVIFLTLILAFYTALMSPVGQHRYRVPVQPELLLLAFYAVGLVYTNGIPWLRSFVWRRFGS